jgi:hypothetical protein
MMSSRRIGRALTSVVLASLVGANVAMANEFAFGRVASDLYDGISGNMGIRTDPATVLGDAYVHFAQMQVPGGVDFIGLGTVKGAGTTGGTVNCSSHYGGAHWTGYYDYVVNGVYACQNFSTSAWVTGDNPSFQILYTTCPTIGTRWVLTFAGAQRTCIYNGNTQGPKIVAGLETLTTADRNIDVKYTNLKKNLPGSSTWSNMGDTRPGYTDPNYAYTYVSTSAFNVFLPPLN